MSQFGQGKYLLFHAVSQRENKRNTSTAGRRDSEFDDLFEDFQGEDVLLVPEGRLELVCQILPTTAATVSPSRSFLNHCLPIPLS